MKPEPSFVNHEIEQDRQLSRTLNSIPKEAVIPPLWGRPRLASLALVRLA